MIASTFLISWDIEADILPKNCRPVSAIIFGLTAIQSPAFLGDGSRLIIEPVSVLK
jgi:hypothetical protein